MMAPLPGAWPERPGSATLPFFGVVPLLVDDKARGCPLKGLKGWWGLLWWAGPAPCTAAHVPMDLWKGFGGRHAGGASPVKPCHGP